MRSLLLPNCKGSHSVRLYRAANRHAAILCSHWSLYIDQWLHWYSSLQMTFAFKMQNQIRQFLPLWRRFDQEYLFRGNYFLSHNVCLYDIYQNLWRHAVFFKPKKVITEKLWNMPFSQVFAFGSCKLFIKSYVLCFFCIFLFLAMDLDTPFEILASFCAFACVVNVYVNCRLE